MKESNIVLSGGAIDTLYKLCVFGACDDGDLPSKAGLSELISHGFALKNYDLLMANHPTRTGIKFFNDTWEFNPIVISRFPGGTLRLILGFIPNVVDDVANLILSDDNRALMTRAPLSLYCGNIVIGTITSVTISTDGVETVIIGRMTPGLPVLTQEFLRHNSTYKIVPVCNGGYFTHYELLPVGRYDSKGVDWWAQLIERATKIINQGAVTN